MQYVESRKIISFLDYWGNGTSIVQISSFYTKVRLRWLYPFLVCFIGQEIGYKLFAVLLPGRPNLLIGSGWHMTHHLFTLNVILCYEFHNDMVLHLYNIYHLSLHFILCLHVSLIVSPFPVFVPFTYTSSSYQVELVFMCMVLD